MSRLSTEPELSAATATLDELDGARVGVDRVGVDRVDRVDRVDGSDGTGDFAAEVLLGDDLDRRRLMEALESIGHALDRQAATLGVADAAPEPAPPTSTTERVQASPAPLPAALDTLAEGFGLSSFERDLLVLAAGVELDSGFAHRCARAQGDPNRTRPTFSLSLACLDDPHWSALAPSGALRHWRLIELEAGPLTAAPLRIDERILHYLLGVHYTDERLAGIVDPVPTSAESLDPLTEGQQRWVDRALELWSQESGGPPPVIQLAGSSPRAVASWVCHRAGLSLHQLRASALPTSAAELDGLARLWEREALLSGSALLIDCEGLDTEGSGDHWSAVFQLVDRVLALVFLASDASRREGRRTRVRFDVPAATPREQLEIWRHTLGPAADRLEGRLEGLASHFRLSPSAIREAQLQAIDHGTSLGRELWASCRRVARPRLDGLARRIDPVATWDDLVLPPLQRNTLRQIAIHLRRQFEVYERWGFAAKSSRGLGLAVLFAGGSGTGKTLAAEVLAQELELDLYHIDLSSVISKYIGETEKKLRQVFDAAEEGGALLLFDEADALFGKRSEVKDSHDRYANIEVSYLLQRMESYRGLSILTTNRKDALDSAFQRRLRFLVQFPFPDANLRAEIWRRVFPPDTPTEGLVPEVLARLDVTGGNIRNIALAAAFLASEAGEPVGMAHLLEAARTEVAKLGKSLSEHETRGWV